MPNILLLGATGYIATPLALSLVRSGNHHVYGLVRRQEVAKSLLANEITPIIGSASDLDLLKSSITKYSIDVVVNCTSAHSSFAEILNAIVEAGKERADALKAQSPPTIGPKLGYIHTSGSGVYGDPTERVNDRSPVGNALAKGETGMLVKMGKVVENEQWVLAAKDVLDVAIVRPHLVYGRSSWALGGWFGLLFIAKNKGDDRSPVEINAKKDSVTGIVHVDDVASGYHAVIDRIEGRLGTWPVFDLLGETLPLSDIVEAAREAMGVKAGVEYVGHKGEPLAELLSVKMKSEASRAKTVLGWYPQKMDFLLNIETYVNAWEAAQDGKEIRVSL
ncbi:hypothetical protein MMC10_010340 [Thelotrema lepadinum]|nr:hypothetical protein [Thelotrema lepadinum]